MEVLLLVGQKGNGAAVRHFDVDRAGSGDGDGLGLHGQELLPWLVCRLLGRRRSTRTRRCAAAAGLDEMSGDLRGGHGFHAADDPLHAHEEVAAHADGHGADDAIGIGNPGGQVVGRVEVHAPVVVERVGDAEAAGGEGREAEPGVR